MLGKDRCQCLKWPDMNQKNAIGCSHSLLLIGPNHPQKHFERMPLCMVLQTEQPTPGLPSKISKGISVPPPFQLPSGLRQFRNSKTPLPQSNMLDVFHHVRLLKGSHGSSSMSWQPETSDPCFGPTNLKLSQIDMCYIHVLVQQT